MGHSYSNHHRPHLKTVTNWKCKWLFGVFSSANDTKMGLQLVLFWFWLSSLFLQKGAHVPKAYVTEDDPVPVLCFYLPRAGIKSVHHTKSRQNSVVKGCSPALTYMGQDFSGDIEGLYYKS